MRHDERKIRARVFADVLAGGAELCDAVVAVAVRHEEAAVRVVDHNVCRVAEVLPVRAAREVHAESERRLRVFIVRSELEHLMEGHVGRPQVALRVEAQSVRQIEQVARSELLDYASGVHIEPNERRVRHGPLELILVVAMSVEALGLPGVFAAREDHDAFRVRRDGHRRDLPEIVEKSLRQLKARVEADVLDAGEIELRVIVAIFRRCLLNRIEEVRHAILGAHREGSATMARLDIIDEVEIAHFIVAADADCSGRIACGGVENASREKCVIVLNEEVRARQLEWIGVARRAFLADEEAAARIHEPRGNLPSDRVRVRSERKRPNRERGARRARDVEVVVGLLRGNRRVLVRQHEDTREVPRGRQRGPQLEAQRRRVAR